MKEWSSVTRRKGPLSQAPSLAAAGEQSGWSDRETAPSGLWRKEYFSRYSKSAMFLFDVT
jgi:hypothetical protein